MAIREATFHPCEGRARKWFRCAVVAVVCLSVTGELVPAGLTDRDKTFGGDIWHYR